MDLHIGTFRVVHDMGDVVVVCFRLPRIEEALVPRMAIGQRGDERLRFCHIHVQGRVAHIRSAVEDEGALQYIAVSQFHTRIGKGIHLLELRELHLPTPTLFVVVGMTEEESAIGVEAPARHSHVGAIDLEVTVGFVTSINVEVRG